MENKHTKENDQEKLDRQEKHEHSDKHEFAFFLENLPKILDKSNLFTNKELRIDDKDLLHRLCNIVRLQIGQDFIIFDKNKNIKVSLTGIEKKKALICKITEVNTNAALEPKINLLVPILKRENFESVIYSCVELGANEITPLITEKSQKNFNHDRSVKILISAAEQSKNFAFTNINAPSELTKYISTNNKKKCINIFFDAEGEKLYDVIKDIKSTIHENINSNINSSINLMIGPEGDLTESEKLFLKNNKFIFCKLTPTILRSFQAVNVGLGAIRSLII